MQRPVDTFIEPLESRIAPSSLVKLTFSTGLLTLNGDDGSNGVVISKSSGTTTITASSGTALSYLGKTRSQVVISKPVSSITAVLNGGVDSIQVTGGFGGTVVLKGGSGDDVFQLSNTRVGGTLGVNANDGNDQVTIGTVQAGALVLGMSNGYDSVVIGDLTVLNSALINLGEQNNAIGSTGTVQIDGDLTINGGSGNDRVVMNVFDFNVGGDITVSLGGGSNYSNI